LGDGTLYLTLQSPGANFQNPENSETGAYRWLVLSPELIFKILKILKSELTENSETFTAFYETFIFNFSSFCIDNSSYKWGVLIMELIFKILKILKPNLFWKSWKFWNRCKKNFFAVIAYHLLANPLHVRLFCFCFFVFLVVKLEYYTPSNTELFVFIKFKKAKFWQYWSNISDRNWTHDL